MMARAQTQKPTHEPTKSTPRVWFGCSGREERGFGGVVRGGWVWEVVGRKGEESGC